MRRVPTIPRALLERIIEVWHPEEIRLFGSRARGDAHERSDWDVLVIVPDSTPDHLLDLVEARRAVRDLHLRADVVPARRSEFEDGVEHFGSLAQIVSAEGHVVYAR